GRLVELGNRLHQRLGIPVADAYVTRGEANIRDDANAVEFLSQLLPVRNELMGVLTRGASQGQLSVHAQQEGEKLVPAGFSADNLKRMQILFEGDMALREREQTIESNKHRQALIDMGVPNMKLLPLPDVPDLPPPAGTPLDTPVNSTKPGKDGK